MTMLYITHDNPCHHTMLPFITCSFLHTTIAMHQQSLASHVISLYSSENYVATYYTTCILPRLPDFSTHGQNQPLHHTWQLTAHTYYPDFYALVQAHITSLYITHDNLLQHTYYLDFSTHITSLYITHDNLHKSLVQTHVTSLYITHDNLLQHTYYPHF